MREWIGGLLLVLGATAFLFFWGVWSPSATNDDAPWVVGLSLHGVSILLLSIGLILAARQVTEPVLGSRVTRAGAAVTVVGLLTVFPLIPLGLGIFAVGLVLAGRDKMGAVVAAAGSAVLLATVVLGARVGMEDAPELSVGLRVAFEVGVLLIGVGLVIVGLDERRRIQRLSQSQGVSSDQR